LWAVSLAGAFGAAGAASAADAADTVGAAASAAACVCCLHRDNNNGERQNVENAERRAAFSCLIKVV